MPRVCALSLISEGLFGVFCAGFCSGGRWDLGVLHSDVISPDNGLVKAGILRAPSSFDCVGQLWRNGHYLAVSGSIKKPPPAPVTPVLGFPQGEGHEPVTYWTGESESGKNTGRSQTFKWLHLALEPFQSNVQEYLNRSNSFSHLDLYTGDLYMSMLEQSLHVEIYRCVYCRCGVTSCVCFHSLCVCFNHKYLIQPSSCA